MFKNPFSFSGRIGRTEYVLSMILTAILLWIFIDISEEREEIWMVFPLAFLIWFGLSQSTKRCHDMGCNGWHQFIPLFHLLMLISEGEEGDNEYGKDPQGRNAPQKVLKKVSSRRKTA